MITNRHAGRQTDLQAINQTDRQAGRQATSSQVGKQAREKAGRYADASGGRRACSLLVPYFPHPMKTVFETVNAAVFVFTLLLEWENAGHPWLPNRHKRLPLEHLKFVLHRGCPCLNTYFSFSPLQRVFHFLLPRAECVAQCSGISLWCVQPSVVCSLCAWLMSRCVGEVCKQRKVILSGNDYFSLKSVGKPFSFLFVLRMGGKMWLMFVEVVIKMVKR